MRLHPECGRPGADLNSGLEFVERGIRFTTCLQQFGQPQRIGDSVALLLELGGVLGLRLEETEAGAVAAQPFIELLLDIRQELRAAKQYAIADTIRSRLADLGVALEDSPGGTTWRMG